MAGGASSSEIIGVFDSRNNLNICHMAVQGKYMPSSLKYMQKHGYAVKTGNREIMSSKEYYTYRLKEFVAHIVNRHPKFKDFLYLFYKNTISYKYTKAD